MKCIDPNNINNIKKEYKKCVIKCLIIFLLFIVFIVLMILVTNREYKQLWINIFTLIFAILLNMLIYIFVEYVLKYKRKYQLYERLLEKKHNVDEVKILNDFELETYNGVTFYAYNVLNKTNKKYRILLDTLFQLDINEDYLVCLSQGVVISYEKK